MYQNIETTIKLFSEENISDERKETLNELKDFIQFKKTNDKAIHLNFICTHNSRRSVMAQVWAETMAFYFDIKDVFCYSGGTEVTAVHPLVIEILKTQGFKIKQLSSDYNTTYLIEFSQFVKPISCFSKMYHGDTNPQTNFAAIITCSDADKGCPMVTGAEKRFVIKYNDPKIYDNTDQQTQKYLERSIEIAQNMWWVFKQIQ